MCVPFPHPLALLLPVQTALLTQMWNVRDAGACCCSSRSGHSEVTKSWLRPCLCAAASATPQPGSALLGDKQHRQKERQQQMPMQLSCLIVLAWERLGIAASAVAPSVAEH